MNVKQAYLLPIILLVICLLFVGVNVHAQKQQLELTNLKTGKTKTFREKKKIKVYTEEFEVKGRLKIIDEHTISIKGFEILISDIKRIRNKATLVKLYSILGIPYGSLFVLGSFVITDTRGVDIGLLFTGIGIIGTSIAATQLRSNFRNDEYSIRIIKKK